MNSSRFRIGKRSDLPVVIARLFNTVGPQANRALRHGSAQFCAAGPGGAPITVYGTGQQSRCFCDVRDAVEALLRLAATDKAVGEVVNVGNDHEITIEGLALLVKERTGSSSPIEYIPYDQAYEPGFEDMFRRVPCLDKLEQLTGFRPTAKLPEIIDRVAAYQSRKKEFVGAPEKPRTQLPEVLFRSCQSRGQATQLREGIGWPDQSGVSDGTHVRVQA